MAQRINKVKNVRSNILWPTPYGPLPRNRMYANPAECFSTSRNRFLRNRYYKPLFGSETEWSTVVLSSVGMERAGNFSNFELAWEKATEFRLHLGPSICPFEPTEPNILWVLLKLRKYASYQALLILGKIRIIKISQSWLQFVILFCSR